MVDDVLINKAAIIERCIARAQEEYQKNPEGFSSDYTRQDAAILNIQRACEATLDMGQYIIRKYKLGLPQSHRDIYELLSQARWISENLAGRLMNMVGFRNISVHSYQKLQIAIVVSIIQQHLNDFIEFSQAVLLYDQNKNV